MLSNNTSSVLLFILPGRKLESLRVLLQGIDSIKTFWEAESLASAQSLLASHAPDFLLLDMALPDQAAWSFLAQVKIRYPHVHCIVLVSDEQRVRAAHHAGADGVLADPISAEALRAAFEPSAEDELSERFLDNVTGGVSSPLMTWETLIGEEE